MMDENEGSLFGGLTLSPTRHINTNLTIFIFPPLLDAMVDIAWNIFNIISYYLI